MIDQPWPFEAEVRELADLIARGQYGAAEGRTGGVRLSAAELAAAVAEYASALAPVPLNARLPLDVIRVERPGLPSWAVVVPMWTREEGRSDLSLELTVRQSPHGGYTLEIDDLHVL
jgi:hypothetical protein